MLLMCFSINERYFLQIFNIYKDDTTAALDSEQRDNIW